MDFHDVIERARKTFFQAFAAGFVVPVAAANDVNAWRAAGVGAVAAAASAVWNKVLNPTVVPWVKAKAVALLAKVRSILSV